MMQKKIKLVHITSSLKIGGAESVLCDLIKNIDHTQFEHHVIYFHDGPHRIILQELGVAVHQIKGIFSLYDPIFFLRLYRKINMIHPDCIHSLLWSANIAGRLVACLLGVPIICGVHNNVDQDGKFRSLCDSLTLPLAHKLIAVSDGVAQSIIKRDRWLRSEKIVIIQNGIDGDQLHKKSRQANKTRQLIGLDQQHFVIGSVGRFVPVKRFDLMLESFAIAYAGNRNMRLVLVGVGPSEAMLKRKVETLGIDQMVIFIIGQSAEGYYPLFDCFAMSSDKEGISLALLEAMSFSLPCIVTNSEPVHAVLHHGDNGILVEAGDALQLACAYEKIAQQGAYAQKIGQSGYQKVQNQFSSRAMVNSYELAFKDCLAKN